MESVTGFKTPDYLCSSQKVPNLTYKTQIKALNKESLESTFMNYLTNNSAVRKKAIKNHNEAKAKTN
jgi:hypothetical protein